MNPHRNFLEAAIAVGLESNIITPEQVLSHLDAELLAKHLPTESVAALLGAGLADDAMNAKLIVDTLGPSVLCEFMPVHLLWATVADAAEHALEERKPKPEPAAPKAEESAPPAATSAKPKSKPKAKAKAKSVTGAGATTKAAMRRPNASRRPERLARTTGSQPTVKPAEQDAKPWSEDPDKTREAQAIGPHPLDDWNEETITGGDVLSRRKR